MSTRFVNPIMQALDDTGVAVGGSRLFFYALGTTTFQDTFQDQALTLPNSNPVETDAGGRFPDIWLQELEYTVRFTIPQNGIDVDEWTVDITGITIPVATETTAGIVRFGTTAEVVAGTSASLAASILNITQDIVLNTARIQSGTFNAARIPTATTSVKGAVIRADAADITNGTADRVVDAAQLKAAIDGVTGDILLRIIPNNTETGAAPTGTRWIGDDATAPLRPDGGILSDVHAVGGGAENRTDQVRYALIQFSVDGGDTWTTAEDE